MTNYRHPSEDERCTAKSKQQGRRCLRYAVPGQKVCYYHGGASPQAKAVADRNLALGADIAIEALVEELSTATTAADRIRAATAILDRAGFGALRRIELTPGAVHEQIEKLRSEIEQLEGTEEE